MVRLIAQLAASLATPSAQHPTTRTHHSAVSCRRYIATDLAQQVLAKEEFKTAVLDRTPAGRVGEPDEVAGAAPLRNAVIRSPPCQLRHEQMG